MAKHKGDSIHGWLIIDKQAGIGSTDVVNQTRRLLNADKNGHTGTLDPFATGVLPIAFGEATKLIPYVTDEIKEYEFTLKFGSTTDTLDLTGQFTQSNGKIPTKDEVLSIIPEFIGKITQIPPAYSAIKINGQRAYDLARKGQDVAIPERQIEIYKLELLSILSDCEYKFKVLCSKGTYVRTLGADIAKKLSTFGHLTALRRTKCAKFDLSHTILLENLKNMSYISARQSQLLPLLTSLCDITVFAVREEDAAKLRMGQKISPKAYPIANIIGQEVIATHNNEAVALVRIEESRISPIRVFNLK